MALELSGALEGPPRLSMTVGKSPERPQAWGPGRTRHGTPRATYGKARCPKRTPQSALKARQCCNPPRPPVRLAEYL
eukprot:6269037-Alexandrium_andersonii.AAC.1